jgi:hypothetical protein
MNFKTISRIFLYIHVNAFERMTETDREYTDTHGHGKDERERKR